MISLGTYFYLHVLDICMCGSLMISFFLTYSHVTSTSCLPSTLRILERYFQCAQEMCNKKS
jgi:hypothetical protein